MVCFAARRARFPRRWRPDFLAGRTRLFTAGLAFAGAMALTGCGPSAPEDNAGTIGNEAVSPADLMDNATASMAAEGPLSAYVGQYPFDAVDGVAFRDHPLVRAALVQAGGENVPVRRILAGPGPSTPIATADDGRILAWGCEQHNCGPHNWTLLVAADGSSPELCYHNEDATPATVWLVDGRVTERSGNCPSEG